MNNKEWYFLYLLTKISALNKFEKEKLILYVKNNPKDIHRIICILEDSIEWLKSIEYWYRKKLNELVESYSDEIIDKSKKIKFEKINKKINLIKKQEEKQRESIDLLLNEI